MNYGSSYNFTCKLLTPIMVALERVKSDKEITSASCNSGIKQLDALLILQSLAEDMLKLQYYGITGSILH